MEQVDLSKGPLTGVRILDFSTLLPGPYATMLLADMGAEVIRIESPQRPDLMREMAPKYDERSYAHLSINRNKQSLAIDLKQMEAKPIIEKLIKSTDIIVEQFRPGVMRRLGIDYDSVKKINSKIIYCSITGYGQTGPYKDRAGHDINYLALSGLASYSGRSDTGPVLSGTQLADIAGGSHHAVMAILAAVIARGVSGHGQFLDISMSDAALALNSLFAPGALATRRDPLLGKEVLNGGIFYDYYQTSDGRFFSVGALEPKFALSFFTAIGKPHWAIRAANIDSEQTKLKQDIAKVFKKKTFAEWQKKFAEKDICVEPVLTISEAADSDLFQQRNMIKNIMDENGNAIPQIACPIKLDSQRSEDLLGRQLGQDTKAVLTSIGLNQDEINQLINSSVVKQYD
ncbi:CoA transferase [Aliikangiella marina]|uniref:CoA transferase n=1 Tax=Aliikangiella marina TaxID=1712262 RepID=A0A545TEG1_9GAMM|nr:CaiB/BaiF CoA-transferase family protein [Aliikangiella marina]TQV75561.1 CoA transferase [Aliikangiella marina]